MSLGTLRVGVPNGGAGSKCSHVDKIYWKLAEVIDLLHELELDRPALTSTSAAAKVEQYHRCLHHAIDAAELAAIWTERASKP